MNDGQTIDLSSLGDVAPPDVVRGAFRRFRRRVFTTGALVAMSALSLAGALVWAAFFHRTIAEKMVDSPGATLGVVVTNGDVVTIVERVARLDDGVGIHLYRAAPDGTTRAEYSYKLRGIRYAEEFGTTKLADHYVVIAPPADGIVRGALTLQEGCRPPPGGGYCSATPEVVETFAIDLAELGVPQDVWEE